MPLMSMMNPEDVETVSYEMGVLLFHGLSQKNEEVKSLKAYDLKENAVYMFKGLESVLDEDFMQMGFENEAREMEMSLKEMEDLFKQTLEEVRKEKEEN